MKSEHIYHLFPLGFTGANQSCNDGLTVENISSVTEMIPHLQSLNVTTVLLGPVFESESHGYDTVDYRQVDRRLGTEEDLIRLIEAMHESGIKVMFDCVFNHVGRSHYIFKDILANREASAYSQWISGLDFNSDNPKGDGLTYDCWAGHDTLVKLNLINTEVREYLADTAESWIKTYNVDGLRMDAADTMDRSFLKILSDRLKAAKPGFMMLGEVVHGDYRQWLEEGGLDAVTNYEAYKGLYSSLNDENYYEIAYALNRQFGNDGIYPSKAMFNFVDNHDVSRVSSVLKDEAHIYPLYIMLYTMPGVPSLYYGSEFAHGGEKAEHSDEILRPSWGSVSKENRDLVKTIEKLATINKENIAIREGGYQQVHIDHKVIGYKRNWSGKEVYVFINAKKEEVTIPTPMVHGEFYDLLNEQDFTVNGNIHIYPNWGRVLLRKV